MKNTVHPNALVLLALLDIVGGIDAECRHSTLLVNIAVIWVDECD